MRNTSSCKVCSLLLGQCSDISWKFRQTPNQTGSVGWLKIIVGLGFKGFTFLGHFMIHNVHSLQYNIIKYNIWKRYNPQSTLGQLIILSNYLRLMMNFLNYNFHFLDLYILSYSHILNKRVVVFRKCTWFEKHLLITIYSVILYSSLWHFNPLMRLWKVIAQQSGLIRQFLVVFLIK